jgi:hypothetical protein
LLAIELEGSHEAWEKDGGHRREALDLAGDILAALHVEPWDMAPPAIEAASPPEWVTRHSELWERWTAARFKLLDRRRRRLLKRGFNFPAHRNLRVSEGVENLLR